MKKIILLILFGLSYAIGYAQPTGTLYFSMTPIDAVYGDRNEGIYKYVDNANDPLYKSPRIFFNLSSRSRDINISFAHISVNPTEWNKICKPSWDDQMEITTIGNNIASDHTVYNLDSYFKTYTRQQLIDWFESLDVRNKKIYFFDQRDYDKGKLTLIQVGLIDYGRPSKTE